ncbi:MAG: hypothetical protein KC619_18320 [Myxococcales bacterium]|nr:hypothetical protein [Myxococcales bacterium]
MRSLLVVLLLALVPAGAAAQDEPADDELSDEALIRWASREIGRSEGRALGERPPVPPDAYLHDGAPYDLHLAGEEDQLGLRLLAEAGGGLVGILAGGGIGAVIVWVASESNADPTWMATAVGAAAILGSVGVTAGVTLAADLTGGRGNFGHAFIGQAIGAVVALPLVVLGLANDALPLSLVAAGVLPLAGAILGYEVGHADRVSAGGPIAFVTPTRAGALATVAGPLW